jgi:uncharacterized membrane protein
MLHRMLKASWGNRLLALDAVRAVAMLLMIQGHTLDALADPRELDITAFPWNIWHFLRGLTAPTFLLISGIVHMFATQRTAEGRLPSELVWRRIRWALTLLGIGYLMMFPARRLWDVGFVAPEQWSAFFRVHILQLIGVTLLGVLGLFAVTRNNRQVAWGGLLLGIALCAVAPAAAAVDWFALLPEAVAAYLSTARGSFFPIVPFSAYLLLGLPLGYVLANAPAERRERLMQRLFLWLGLGTVALAVPLAEWFAPLVPAGANPYHANPGLILLRFGLALLLAWGISWLYILTPRLQPYYVLAGRYALHVFVGHLVLLYGTPWFSSIARWYPKALPLWQSGLIALGVIGACLAMLPALEWLRRSQWSWKLATYGSAIGLVYLLLF